MDLQPSGAGLCDLCVHQHVIHSGRGSRFSSCRLSRADPRFPRYPMLPVLRCEGFAPRSPATNEPET